jgi:hypothetical protein
LRVLGGGWILTPQRFAEESPSQHCAEQGGEAGRERKLKFHWMNLLTSSMTNHCTRGDCSCGESHPQ